MRSQNTALASFSTAQRHDRLLPKQGTPSRAFRLGRTMLLASAMTAALTACAEVEDQEFASADQSLTAASDPSATPSSSAPRDGRGARWEGPGEFRNHGDPARLFSRFDQDGDGKIPLSNLPTRAQERLATADANRDKNLTLEELKAHRSTRGPRAWGPRAWAEFDQDGDGSLSDSEKTAMHRAHLLSRFAEGDANSDGFLIESEVPAFRWQHLSVADANGDARLTREELQTAVENGTLKRPDRPRGPGGCPGASWKSPAR